MALRYRYFGSAAVSADSSAWSSGANAIHPNAARQGGSGPAIGNGRLSRNAESNPSEMLVSLGMPVDDGATGIWFSVATAIQPESTIAPPAASRAEA